MSRVATVALTIALAAGGCERPGERPPDPALAGRVLSGALAYPQSVLLTMATGEDAAELTLTTAADVTDVVTWYRAALRLNGWTVQSERREDDGGLTLYATNRDRPLWIRLRANIGGPGTTYSLIGAEVAGDTVR